MKSRFGAQRGIPREARELSFINRYAIARVHHQQSVAEHSYYVILYSLIVAEFLGHDDPTMVADMVRYAALHDNAEAATGDNPSPYKQILNRKYGGGPADIEFHYMATRYPNQHEWWDSVSPLAKAVVRVADMLDSVFYCCTEEQMGNQTLGQLTSQDIVDAASWPTPDRIGSNGVIQMVLVQLAKAWFNGLAKVNEDIPMTRDRHSPMLLMGWENFIKPAIWNHRWGQSDILDATKDMVP